MLAHGLSTSRCSPERAIGLGHTTGACARRCTPSPTQLLPDAAEAWPRAARRCARGAGCSFEQTATTATALTALAWIAELLQREGIDDGGRVWLHLPRVLGFVFKPVSFWYAHRADGSLRAMVA